VGADRAASAQALCPRTTWRWSTREILNAIFYVLRGGLAWRLLPSDLPPKSTVFR
jgi:transposase